MALEFAGMARPIDSEGFEGAAEKLGIRAAELWTVVGVETSGCGYLADRRPTILFERHVFSKETKRRFDAKHGDISNRHAGGYGAAGSHQYERLASAISLDRQAALRSTSWGIGQVMGYNAAMAGYADAEEMIEAMSASETAQFDALAAFIRAAKLDGVLRTHDWGRFAAGYNGPNYRINNYDTRLAATFQRFERGALPDLQIRAAQLYLTYLGFDPQGVDGIMGRFTRSAMNEFQDKAGIQMTDFVDDDTFAALKKAAIDG
ncbi:N-acetylmuramidase domain-containing protein [Azoarcus sp. KH32C]|uniref:N-acetylmuramidase domain-containing protein n=1 Tax=Azoarcus sp. KH32C TaxID=748247 RepID=UPI0002385CF4|nr:N-acetylmuramidase domain-containing protein [Azoarcus sp. KH32C]BAL27487.1 peptidoglycan-binding domain 1 protein [Azoarcus sp. KH32C]